MAIECVQILRWRRFRLTASPAIGIVAVRFFLTGILLLAAVFRYKNRDSDNLQMFDGFTKGHIDRNYRFSNDKR